MVAIDIETTGLDPKKDAIIEIAAVRFAGQVIQDEWACLINPGRPIPPFITQLTGISNEMIVQAPQLQEVYPDFIEFVGKSPLVGHNIRFDLSFLSRRGGLQENPIIDTYELAAVLLPRAERYNLGALGDILRIDLPAAHRALADARLTCQVYLQLFEIAQRLPANLVAEIVQLSAGLDWGGAWAFQAVLRVLSQKPVKARPAAREDRGPYFEREERRSQPPLRLVERPLPLDVDEVAALLEPGGAFSAHFPNFEYRPEQVAMLRAVAEAISENRHLLAEAGTGTGKSVAYLLPAAIWAVQNQTRVVVSTNTINLQEQLINKDIPDIQSVLNFDLRAAVMKGRSNYLCPRRLESLHRRTPATVEELRVLSKVLVWQQESYSGDRSEINLNGPQEREVWSRLSADDVGCTTETCLKRTGGTCPFYRARQAANSAHLLIVNHALLLSDVATGNRVLPEYDHLIVDEGHHLEEATTNALSYRATQTDVERMLRELGSSSSGMMGRLLTTAMDLLNPEQNAALDYMVSQITDLAFRFDHFSREFFSVIDQFMFEHRQGSQPGAYGQQVRILPAIRTLPAWLDVEVAWDDGQRTLKALLQGLGDLVKAAGEMTESEVEDIQDLYGNLSNLLRRLFEFHEFMEALVFKPDPDQVYWVELQANGGRLVLQSAPLHIGKLMEKHLWHEKASIVLTSATLATAGEFDYLRERLSAYDAEEISLGSPFDYESATLLYLVNDIPEPNDRNGHQKGIETGLVRLFRATGGRALVLFTAYDQLKRTSRAIGPVLSHYGITVLEQGEGASPHTLLETFRDTPQAVLLGTRAFWEGVDVPGEALSVLVITKLPFDVPSDPIIAARSETFEDPFYQYSLPEAILRFRQGFGRLIRTQYDRGVVAVLDRRILTKKYGRLFTDSLPECTVRVGPLGDLPQITAQWLNL
jgi:DNA polymerase-3 subunit epsilon/ATP-dependent DNA helicase DinG